MSHFNEYLHKINKQFQSGLATEHSYRAPFQNYLDALLPEALITNEAKRTKVGAPDFILMDKKNIPFAYIETKDIGKSLDSKEYKEQFDRYKSGLDVLIITDYMEFRLFKRGILTQHVTIAKHDGNQIVPYNDIFTANTEGVRQFEYLIQGLLDRDGVNITIKSAEDLAKRMAAKARLFADVIFRALEVDDAEFEMADGALSKQFESFKQILIGDISHKEFADIYAQTITYGMFAARLHDTTLEDFSRQEAAELIPKSNPFLRKLFQYVASHDLDDRIKWIVDDLAEVFRYTDVAAILKDFGKATQQTDPLIHFYETFLATYDASLRKARGVWYTPEPVVNFIVRAVDEILKTEFQLKDGLADTSKVPVNVATDNFDAKKQAYTTVSKDVHRVQLLDPACGTGTFLAETIKHIHKKFKNQAGIWNTYVEEHLIPRLHGFELLMASYAMAHIKMDLLLRETGYTLKQQKRFKIFLTNALEEHHKDAKTLFWGQWLADEAKQADAVKRDAPVMVVLGNPPYSVSSSNKSAWIQNLIADYKKDLKERKINLDDDYIKFIRFGQHFIEKNTEGVLAFISNNSFIDGITHRQMRKSLLESFDTIYILDLHGSAKKQETALDGSTDQNVFDIQQGVSINLFIKTGKKKEGELAQVFHLDMYGNRKFKYDMLSESSLKSLDWKLIECKEPYNFFVPKDFNLNEGHNAFFSIADLFTVMNSGVKTDRDSLFIDFEKLELMNRFKILLSGNISTSFRNNYRVVDSGSFKITERIKNKTFDSVHIRKNMYRVFDERYTYYDSTIISRPANHVMKHLSHKNNLSLITCRQQSTFDFQHIFMSRQISDINSISLQTKEISYVFPLYLYPDSSDLFAATTRVPNLKTEIIEQLGLAIGRVFRYAGQPVSETSKVSETLTTKHTLTTKQTFTPEDVLDYIYAVLHTPQYRAQYKEFLKIDFPRVPYPKDAADWDFKVKQGTILRGLHLLESEDVEDYLTQFPESGDNLVAKPRFEASAADASVGKVWLNGAQYFDGVPLAAWEFYIGGYQPAQKWLKDRIGRRLTFEEVLHYQKMIRALWGTVEVMGVLGY